MLSLLESKSIENLGIESFESFRCILGHNFMGHASFLHSFPAMGKSPIIGYRLGSGEG